MKTKTRIHDWFVGKTLSGESVKFKFTYSWNLKEQVLVESNSGLISMSLPVFHRVVIPKVDIKKRFIVAR